MVRRKTQRFGLAAVLSLQSGRRRSIRNYEASPGQANDCALRPHPLGGYSAILPNLRTFTGPASYGRPVIQKVFEWE